MSSSSLPSPHSPRTQLEVKLKGMDCDFSASEPHKKTTVAELSSFAEGGEVANDESFKDSIPVRIGHCRTREEEAMASRSHIPF